MINPNQDSPYRVYNSKWTDFAGDHKIRGHDGIIYGCIQVSMIKEKWKEDFRKKNRTDEIISSGGRDRYYERFCQEIEDSIKCKCYEKALEMEERRKKFMGEAGD